jgi:hypothetical protein
MKVIVAFVISAILLTVFIIRCSAVKDSDSSGKQDAVVVDDKSEETKEDAPTRSGQMKRTTKLRVETAVHLPQRHLGPMYPVFSGYAPLNEDIRPIESQTGTPTSESEE